MRSFARRAKRCSARLGGWRRCSALPYFQAVAQVNNAAFAAQASYFELEPDFRALFIRENGAWQRFYAAARALALRPTQERSKQLKQWAQESASG